MAHPDFLIAGAGIIGLSLALELHRRGHAVTVVEAGRALAQTSSAAAGMLAAEDPANPAALAELAALSIALYPDYLDRLTERSGLHIPFQTASTLQAVPAADPHLEDPVQLLPQLTAGPHTFSLLAEHSVDPRQLASVLLAAVKTTDIVLLEQTSLTRIATSPVGVTVQTEGDSTRNLQASHLIDCMGSWSPAPVRPRKGQMLAVAAPPGFELPLVVRTEDVYLVPRLLGPSAGRIVIGATVEDAGFDLSVQPSAILGLHARATSLLPGLREAKFLESWSGLRPSTADDLPILGASPRQPRYVLATGHYRNGILLAPATASVIAQLLLGESPSVDLAAFQPGRFKG